MASSSKHGGSGTPAALPTGKEEWLGELANLTKALEPSEWRQIYEQQKKAEAEAAERRAAYQDADKVWQELTGSASGGLRQKKISEKMEAALSRVRQTGNRWFRDPLKMRRPLRSDVVPGGMCRLHKACRTNLTHLSQDERREHVRMHDTEECMYAGCHAWVNLMNDEEHWNHHIMHIDWESEETAGILGYLDYLAQPSDASWQICPRDSGCHARLDRMKEVDLRWHDHMHTARRCMLNRYCKTPLDVLDGHQIIGHFEMHRKQNECSADGLKRMEIESPGLFEKISPSAPASLGASQMGLAGGNYDDDGSDEAEGDPGTQVNSQVPVLQAVAPPPNKKQKTVGFDKQTITIEKWMKPKGQATGATGATGEESADKDVEEEIATGQEEDETERQTEKPPRKRNAPASGKDTGSQKKGKKAESKAPTKPPKKSAKNDAAGWEDGWEAGVDAKDSVNKFEHCGTCDAFLGGFTGKLADKKAKHLAKCGDGPVKWKSYRGGKKRKR